MIQILEENIQPRQQTFMDRLGKGLFQGGQAAGQLIPEYLQQQQQMQQQDAQSKQLSDYLGIDVTQYNPETQKLILEKKLQGDLLDREYGLKSDIERLKGAEKAQEGEQLLGRTQNAFNDLVGLLEKGNIGVLSGIGSLMGGETAKDVGEFQALTGGLEAGLVDLVSRGTLSNSRFEYIKDYLLPKPNDTKNKIRGKLKGIAEIIGLDSSALTGKTQGNQALDPTKRAKLKGIIP